VPISVYIDNNVWNFLFDRQLVLAAELPSDEFCVCITREAEFEIPAIPPDKAELKTFIQSTIAQCEVRTDRLFGFNDASLPADEQRVGGFGIGRWASQHEIAFIRQQRTPLRNDPKRSTKLYKDEADIALAARSFEAVVLSLDRKQGPLNAAYRQGGRVVFLNDFDQAGISLADLVRAASAGPPPTPAP